MNTSIPLSLIVCAALLIGWPRGALAQPLTPRATDAHLQIFVAMDGDAYVTLTVPAPLRDPAAVEETLHQVLGRPLLQVTRVPALTQWRFVGHARSVLTQQGLAYRLDIDPGPLAVELRRNGLSQFLLEVEHPIEGFSEFADTPPFRPLTSAHIAYQRLVSTDDPPAPLPLRFGYHLSHLWGAAVLAVLFFLPIGFTLWQRTRIAQDVDPAVTWYRHWYSQQVLLLVTWVAWGLAVPLVNIYGPTAVLAGHLGAGRGMVWTLLLAPPAVALGCCHVLSALVYSRLPEAGWTRQAVWRQAFWGQETILAVLVSIGMGMDMLQSHGMSGATVATAVCGLAAFLGLVGWGNAQNRTMTPLPPGEVRDRLFELADDTSTTVQQAYLLPAAQWRLLRVFAIPGNTVHLASSPVERLTRREVDAVLAMELAWLWRQRVRQLWMPIVFILTMALVAGVVGLFTIRGLLDQESPPFLILGVLLALRTITVLRRGRFDSSLDLEAVRLTGDPEALLTALAKLEQARLLPLPSAPDRIEALAARLNIPPERLREVLERPGSSEGQYATPTVDQPKPAAEAPLGSPVAARRKLVILRLFWGEVAMRGLLPVLGVAAGARTGAGILVGGLIGAALVVLLRRLIINGTVASMRRDLRRRLTQTFPALAGEELVGFAPAAAPRIYEGFYDWDAGFWVTGGDRLGFIGERTSFTLRRDQVTGVRLGPPAPAWWAPPRIYVTWHDEASTAGGTFQFAVVPLWPWQGRQRVKAILARLETWRTGAGAMPPTLLPAEPGLPPTEKTTPGQSPASVQLSSTLFALLFPAGLFAVLGCVMLGLPFNPEQGGGGLLALAAVVGATLWELVPYWFYREPREGAG